MPVIIYMSSLEKKSIQVFYPFFNWVAWFSDIELYELIMYLDINPWSCWILQH